MFLNIGLSLLLGLSFCVFVCLSRRLSVFLSLFAALSLWLLLLSVAITACFASLCLVLSLSSSVFSVSWSFFVFFCYLCVLVFHCIFLSSMCLGLSLSFSDFSASVYSLFVRLSLYSFIY